MMKKSIPLGYKSKKKSIPININSNPAASKFLTTNQINQVAASYLSMGQKIQILKNPKMIHVNTNSALNYYTNPGNDSRQTNSSIGNSYLNNYPNIGIKNNELSGINFNNHLNNLSQQNHSGNNNINKNNQNPLKFINMNSSSFTKNNQQKSELEILHNINKNSNNELGKINENNSSKTNSFNINLDIIDSFNIEGIIQCDMPNPSLYMLNGKANMHLNGKNNEFPLDGKNLLLKGAKLRNTEWIVGIIIYTGHSCKIMKNAKDPILKMSSVEKILNKLLVGIFICKAFFSLLSALFHYIFFKKEKSLILQNRTIEENN